MVMKSAHDKQFMKKNKSPTLRGHHGLEWFGMHNVLHLLSTEIYLEKIHHAGLLAVNLRKLFLNANNFILNP